MLTHLVLIVCAQAPVDFPGRYQEPYADSHGIRQELFTQLGQYIEHLKNQAPQKRENFVQLDYSSLDAYEASTVPLRDTLKSRIGYPPPDPVTNSSPRIEAVGEDDYATIFRVWLEVLPGVEAYGLLFVPHNLAGKAPLLICQHGGGGSPELISAFEGPGNYGWMVQRGLQAGFICYAPSLLFPLGGKEEIEGPNRRQLDESLKTFGTSILAVEIYKIHRALDLLTARDDVDPQRIGMMGLSYGGCYTIYTTALEPRIKAAVSSCYFNARENHAWSDWSYFNMLNEFADPEIVALICPRPLMIEVGIRDELFTIDGARQAAPAARAHYEHLGIADRFHFIEFDGGHEFRGDTAYDFMHAALGNGG